MSADQGKQSVDKSAPMLRANLEKGVAAAEESAKGIGQGFSAAAESLREFNLKLVQMAHANTTAALEFARRISTANGPSEVIELWSSQARKQFETLTEQSKELAALGQKIASTSAEPIARSFSRVTKAAS
jgi:phasin